MLVDQAKENQRMMFQLPNRNHPNQYHALMHVMMVCITGQNIEVISWIADYVKSEIAVFTIKSVTFAYPWAIFATAFFSFTQNKVGEKFLCSNKKKKCFSIWNFFCIKCTSHRKFIADETSLRWSFISLILKHSWFFVIIPTSSLITNSSQNVVYHLIRK